MLQKRTIITAYIIIRGDKSHPNLGYDFKGQGREYSFTDSWPESDLEMIDQTTSDYLTPDENGEIQPFHIYYLTISRTPGI